MTDDLQTKNAPENVDLANDPLMGRLKSMFDEVAQEPLPDFMIALLQKLDEAERRG